VKQADAICSGHLYVGRRLSSRAFFGKSIPQLDPGAPNTTLCIPMPAGKVGSLNLANAVSIVLYEALRQVHGW
jgi:tRNA(Leu) C34 or U34 (ribose-2'-O)-methylase TrmL